MSEQIFSEELLAEHNNLRQKIGNVNPLELDADLSQKALRHAEYLAQNKLKLENSDDETLGENLYYFESDDGLYDARHILDYWIQKSKIDLNNLTMPAKTSHFTQIVWKSSEKLGVGVSQSTNGGIYVVAFYFPRGNVINYLDDNVLVNHRSESGNGDHEHSDSSESKHNQIKKEKRPADKVNQILEKIVKKADKEKTGKISLTKAKKVFQLINEKFGTNYTNMDAKVFFEKFENLDEQGKVNHKEFRKSLANLNLKLNH